MDVNRSTSGVERKPIITNVERNGLYLWLIVGCSLGGALLLTLGIAALLYYRRRHHRKFTGGPTHSGGYIPGSEFCPQDMISSFSSSASEDTIEGLSSGIKALRRPLGPSASLDHPSLLQLNTQQERVQPRPILSRWHTLASPLQTTPVLMDQPSERDSDDDVSRSSPPCLHGRLWFSVRHISDTSQLHVTVHKAKYLPGRGLINGPRDPYVKVYLLPEEEIFYQTKIRKKTLSPKFNEAFAFKVNTNDVRKRTLKLSVYDVDKRKVRHCLGHVMQPLDNIQMTGEIVYKDLEVTPQPFAPPGEIQVCLSCNPFSNRIKVTICRIKNLHLDLPTSEPTIFVRIELYHGRRLVKCKKTQSVRISGDSEEVVFDESFGFGVSGRFFDSCSLSLVVVPEGCTVAPIGRVVLGPFLYARGDSLQHWQEMLSNPRNAVTRWHKLEECSGTNSPRKGS